MCYVRHVEMKSVYASQPKKMSSFYDCKKCKACSQVLNIPLKDWKPTIMLFGGDGTDWSHKPRLRKWETISIFEENLRLLTMKHTRTRAKKGKNHSLYGIIVSNLHWLMQMTNIFSCFCLFLHFQSTVEQHIFLSLQRRYWVVSRLWTRFSDSNYKISSRRWKKVHKKFF